MGLTRPRLVPLINLRLKILTYRQQLSIARPQVVEDRFKICPEFVAVDPRTRYNLLVDQLVKFAGDL